MRRIETHEIRAIHSRIISLSGEDVAGERMDPSIVVDVTFEVIFGTERHPTLPGKAASYLWRLASGHYFHQGNKRTALLVTLTFLSANGIDPERRFAEGELWRLVENIADAATRPPIEDIVAFFEERLGSGRGN